MRKATTSFLHMSRRGAWLGSGINLSALADTHDTSKTDKERQHLLQRVIQYLCEHRTTHASQNTASTHATK